jgi:hypothetical protein
MNLADFDLSGGWSFRRDPGQPNAGKQSAHIFDLAFPKGIHAF